MTKRLRKLDDEGDRLLPRDAIPTNFRERGRLSPEGEQWLVDYDNAMAEFYLTMARRP